MRQDVLAVDLVVQGVEAIARLLPSLSRVTPSAASEHFSELLGCPISASLATCCVCPELRPLPSTGITRLHRYYGPLRHPRAPGLSLTGVRLIIPDHAMGLPVLRALPLCTCCRHYPGAATGCSSARFPSRSAFPDNGFGSACASSFSRLARRSLALRPAHSRVTLFRDPLHRRLQPFRYLHELLRLLPAGAVAGWDFHPLESAAFSRRTRKPTLTTDGLGSTRVPRARNCDDRPHPAKPGHWTTRNHRREAGIRGAR